MNVLFSIAEKIYESVKNRFFDEINGRTEKPIALKDEDPVWNAIDKITGEKLFDTLIAKKAGYNSEYLYRHVKHGRTNDKVRSILGIEYIGFKDESLNIFLNYLGFSDDSFSDESLRNNVLSFCENFAIDAKDIENQKLVWKETLKKNKQPRENIQLILELRKELGKAMYEKILENQMFWFYFYGYDKHKLKQNKGTWHLIKLVLVFEAKNKDGNLPVRIDNSGTEHYDYIGTVDFQSSIPEIIVINLYTVPFLGRQLNIKIHFGTGEGDIFLGQYLNYESDNHIISGTVLLERISEIDEPKSKVHNIPNLSEGQTEYTEDFEGVSKYILQYFHDKTQNFRRTPLRSAHTLIGLKNWLETRKSEEN